MSVEKAVRKSLKTLQSTAKSADILVGRQIKTLKSSIINQIDSEIHKDENKMVGKQKAPKESEVTVEKPAKTPKHSRSSESPPFEVEVKKKNAAVQVRFTNKISEADLTSPKGASDNYWKILAEKKQKTIDSLLDEKYIMKKKLEELENELTLHKQMLEEASSFVDVIKDLTNNDKNDTGIDVNEVSSLEDEDDSSAEISQNDSTENDK